MKTIINDFVSEIEIEKSRFITLLYKIKTIAEVEEKMNQAKNIYKNATHYCYAYIVDDNRKSSDDGEPGGTAGVPMMEVLLKNEMNYILCIVIRYFGGIKLGTGGLVRAYSRSVTTALDIKNIIDLITGYVIEFTTNYENQKRIDHLLKDIKKEKEYLDTIKYKVIIPKEEINKLNSIDYKIIEETLIEKK